MVRKSKASVIIIPKDSDVKKKDAGGRVFVLVDDPKKIFIKIADWCFPTNKKKGEIHKSSVIDPDATIDPSVYIGPHCVIGKCNIDTGTIIYANVVINEGVSIGKKVIINPGCVIGFDGFGYYKDEDGALKNFPHYGSVIIEDDAEIGSNTSIDRGTLGNTIIKKGAKIDNLVHIAHNVVVGENSMVIAHSMIGGSTKIGKNVWIAPNAAVIDGIKIGDNSLIGLGAVVIRDVPQNAIVYGNPAKPHVSKKSEK